MPKYLYNIGLGLSVTLNALLGGQPYQTFSAINFYWYIKNKYNINVKILNNKYFNETI